MTDLTDVFCTGRLRAYGGGRAKTRAVASWWPSMAAWQLKWVSHKVQRYEDISLAS